MNVALLGARACLENASCLLQEALLLFENGYYPRTFALCEIANEEIGKIAILLQIAVTSSMDLKLLELIFNSEKKKSRFNKKKDLQILWDSFYYHDIKASLALMKRALETNKGKLISNKEHQDLSELEKIIGTIVMVYANPEYSNLINRNEIQIKNDSFFIDYDSNTKKWKRPEEEIGKEKAFSQVKVCKDLLEHHMNALTQIQTDNKRAEWVMKFREFKKLE
jgi:hypothetical protein